MELKVHLSRFIRGHMSRPENNNIKVMDRAAFGTPIVAFSRADDPWYPRLREHIDAERYMLPTGGAGSGNADGALPAV